MKRLQPRCSEDGWQSLLAAINKNADRVVVRSSDLKDLASCHGRSGGKVPSDLLSASRRMKMEMDRESLFRIVHEHGLLCGHDGDGFWHSLGSGIWKWETLQ